MTKKAAAARKAGAARRLEAAAREQKVTLVRAPGAHAPAANTDKATPVPGASASRPASPPRSQPTAAPAPRPTAKRPVTPPPAPPARAVSRATATRPTTARARSAPPIEQQYAYVKGDLRLIGVLAAVMFVVIIALHFYLPS